MNDKLKDHVISKALQEALDEKAILIEEDFFLGIAAEIARAFSFYLSTPENIGKIMELLIHNDTNDRFIKIMVKPTAVDEGLTFELDADDLNQDEFLDNYNRLSNSGEYDVKKNFNDY